MITSLDDIALAKEIDFEGKNLFLAKSQSVLKKESKNENGRSTTPKREVTNDDSKSKFLLLKMHKSLHAKHN